MQKCYLQTKFIDVYLMCKKHKGKKPSVHIHLSTIYHKGGAKPRVKRDWMRQRRKELELTQVQLSAKANVSIRSISHAEMGTRDPEVPTAKRLASVLGVHWTKFYEE
jgi:DNA-binding XRE family transcriptional regulator